jgi:hypothetical protein
MIKKRTTFNAVLDDHLFMQTLRLSKRPLPIIRKPAGIKECAVTHSETPEQKLVTPIYSPERRQVGAFVHGVSRSHGIWVRFGQQSLWATHAHLGLPLAKDQELAQCCLQASRPDSRMRFLLIKSAVDLFRRQSRRAFVGRPLLGGALDRSLLVPFAQFIPFSGCCQYHLWYLKKRLITV